MGSLKSLEVGRTDWLEETEEGNNTDGRRENKKKASMCGKILGQLEKLMGMLGSKKVVVGKEEGRFNVKDGSQVEVGEEVVCVDELLGEFPENGTLVLEEMVLEEKGGGTSMDSSVMSLTDDDALSFLDLIPEGEKDDLAEKQRGGG